MVALRLLVAFLALVAFAIPGFAALPSDAVPDVSETVTDQAPALMTLEIGATSSSEIIIEKEGAAPPPQTPAAIKPARQTDAK